MYLSTTFKSQQQALTAAHQIIQKIFSEKSYTNPQKLSLLISQYQAKQQKLDQHLSTAIYQQITSIQQSKTTIHQANKYMREANQKTEKIKQLWLEQQEFHEFMEHVYTLQTFMSNINKVIEQLTYFVDMESELSKLQKLSEDQSKYMYVNQKLLNLIELRNALLEDVAWQRENTLMRKEFVKVDNLEISFYDKIFSCFSDLLKSCKENRDNVTNSAKVIDAYDKALEAKGKPRVMRDRAIQMIKQSVDTKFMDNLSNHDQLIEIIQNAKFAMTDLVEIGDYVAPCFSKEFPIMELFQKAYKENIEKYIVPYFDRIEEENQYGNLVVLLGWIDDYETMLARAGLDSTNLVSLKSKVKLMMPFFIDHNRDLVADYIRNCLKEDEKNYCRKFYQEVHFQSDYYRYPHVSYSPQALMDNGQLISFFPSDIFRFINQEADIMQDKLKGQVFVEFVRCITEQLNDFQRNLANQVLQELETIKMIDNEDRIVDYEYKLILFVNNYNECLKHAGESKEIFASYVADDYRSRIEKIFMNQVQKQFNASIPRFIGGIIEIIFMKVITEIYPQLFTQKWLNDNSRTLITNVKNTITVQLSDINEQSLVINPIHYRILVKETLQYFVNSYVEQLILFIRIMYSLQSPSQLKVVSQAYTRKRLQSDPDCYKQVFNSKSGFSEAIKKDKHIFVKFLQTFRDSTSQALVTKLTNKFVILSDLFAKKKGEFEQLLNKVADLFPQKASELIEAVFIVRDDVESRQATFPRKGMGIGVRDY